MAEIEVRRANTTLSSDHAFDQFTTWLDSGIFSKKGIIGDAETSILELHPSYLRVHARFSALWSCDLGVFDKAAYERDYNSYIFLHNQWESRGKHSYPPKQPDREAYYRSSKDNGSDEDAVVCSISLAIGDGDRTLKPIEKVYGSFCEPAWSLWSRAVAVGEDTLPDGDIRAVAHGVAKSVAEGRLISRIKQEAGRRADKVSNIRFDMDLTVERLEVIQIPFWTIAYRHNRKNYVFAIDGISGKYRGGTRPIDKKRVALAAAAAGALALGGGAYASWESESRQAAPQPLTESTESRMLDVELPAEDGDAIGLPAPAASATQQTQIENATSVPGSTEVSDSSGDEVDQANQPSASVRSEGGQAVAPKGAMPINPSTWVTMNDYPAMALREGSEGLVAFRVTISPQGFVDNCEVTGTSGNPDLDQTTCRVVTQRARFHPATDERGVPTAGSYSSRVRWVLP